MADDRPVEGSADHRRTEESLRFLIEASTLLAASLDDATTLANVVDLIVPRLADWCVVDIVDDADAIRRLAMAHADPNQLPLLRELEDRYPHRADDRTGPARVMRTGEPDFYPVMPEDAVETAARDADHLHIMRALRMGSYLCVPLIARDRRLGAMSFVHAESGRHFSTDDLALAEELARRVAIAIDNAILFSAERASRTEAERTQQRLAFLADASRVLGASLDYDITLNELARRVVPELADLCVIDVVSDDGTLYRPAVAHSEPGIEQLVRELGADPNRLFERSPAYRRVFETGEPELVQPVPVDLPELTISDPAVREQVTATPFQSILLVPLVVHERIIGAISFSSTTPDRYSVDDVTFAKELAARAAVAVENARLYREAQVARAQVQRHADRLAVLAEASRAFAEARLDPQALLDTIAEQTALRLGDICIIRLLSDDGEWLLPAAAYDPDPDALAYTRETLSAVRHHRTEGLNGEVIRTGLPVLIPDVTPDALLPLIKPEYAEHLQRVGTHSLLIVPLAARGRIIGTLGMSRSQPQNPYTVDDQTLLQDLADRAATAIESARLFTDASGAEARYRSLFENVADAIFVADAEGNYLDVNPAVIGMLGYSRDELLTMRVADIIPAGPEWTESEYRRYKQAGAWHGELTLRRKDGSLVPVEASATVAELPDGPVYLSSARDISERHAAQRMQQEFMAMVTHDLKSPLTTIKGFAQLMQRRAAYSDRSVEAILTQASHLERLINDLLDAARLEAGRAELRPRRIDLVGLTLDVAEHNQALAHDHLIRVDAHATSITGMWDGDRISQVLQNLLSNAVKYSPRGGEIVVTVERVPAAGDNAEPRACVSISDQGQGIPDDALSRVFDRFFRVDVDGGPQGLGLGLFIARSLVEAHGGEIGVTSTPGAGSTFWFALPVEGTGNRE